MSVFILFIVCSAVLLCRYAYLAFKDAIGKKYARRIFISAAILLLILFTAVFICSPEKSYRSFNSLALLMVGVPVVFSGIFIVMFLQDIVRFFRFLIARFRSAKGNIRSAKFPPRSRKVALGALLAAGVMLGVVIYGTTEGKHHWTVHRLTLCFEELPEGLDGTTVGLISDLHLSSFKKTDPLPEAFDILQNLRPDLIVLSGDAVNGSPSDFAPWITELQNLHAPLGKYAVMGNHDYFPYSRQITQQERQIKTDSVRYYYRHTGFRLLDNEHAKIVKNNDTLYLAGVEYWGQWHGMTYGDLDRAVEGIPKDGFILLVSHDPEHFAQVIKDHPRKIPLTLSGHTHGMQLGFEWGPLRFSPIMFFSPQWAGLYRENGRMLYVNRGLGYHAFRGRIGIWPEITLITLKKKE